MHKIAEVKPLKTYRLRVRFEDGTEGEVDLSHLAGKGVFSLWNEKAAFEAVSIGGSGQLIWGEDIDLCPDAIYLQLTGKRPDELFGKLTETP